MKHLFLVIIFSGFDFISIGQQVAVDSKGKDIYSFYTTKTFSLPVTSANTSIKLGYNIPIGIFKDKKGKQWYIKENKLANYTIATSESFNVQLSATNLGKNFAQLSSFHPTYGLNIGYSSNIDIFNNWDNIDKLARTFPNIVGTWSISGYANLNNLKIYDTLRKTDEPRRHPVTVGVIIDGTLYPKSTRVFALSASVTFEKGSNVDDLKNYQVYAPTYINSSIISLGDYVGKLGDLKRTDNMRVRFSMPLFIDALKSESFLASDNFFNKLTHISIIPYVALYGPMHTRLNTAVGGFINLLGAGYGKRDSKIVPGGGIGLDKIWSGGKWSSINVFVSGTFNFDLLFNNQKLVSKDAK